MINNDIITVLYAQPQTVFSMQEISLLFPHVSAESLRDRLYYFTKKGKIQRLHHGVYGKKTYDPLELANKIYTPSYISLETVLAREGVVFQYYETIFLMSYVTRDVQTGEHSFSYKRLPNYTLFNTEGIEQVNQYAIATKERAFLDAVFKYKNYYFDNLRSLNWDRIMEIKHIYRSTALTNRVETYYQLYLDNHVKTGAS